MISVGIDVSKGKSTVCAMRCDGKILLKSTDYEHTKTDLSRLCEKIRSYDEETKMVMEITGGYHMPILNYLVQEGFWVSVVNALLMNKQAVEGLHDSKTDKIDAKKIANYGTEKWYKLKKYVAESESYSEIRFYSRQYDQATEISTKLKCQFDKLIDGAMPGINKLLRDDKMHSFIERYVHFERIIELGKDNFINDYCQWAKGKGYRDNERKSHQIWRLVQNAIPYMPSTETIANAIVGKVILIRESEKSRNDIIAKIIELTHLLPEYKILTEMKGIGDVLAARLIAEIGDVRRFENRGSLISYAGIDVPDNQSGQYRAKSGKISKRGNKRLRRIGYEIMQSIVRHKPTDDNAVYQFILKKECEGKRKKSAKIAGFNKFLRIYYARVTEEYRKLIPVNGKTATEVTA